MALGKRLINTGAAVETCNTESVQAFGADNAYSSNIALYELDGNDNDTTTNYNGTNDPNVTYSSTGAYIGQAAIFNGSNSYINLPLTSLFFGKNTLSVSLWFKTTTTTRSRIFTDYAQTSRNCDIIMNANGTVEVTTDYNQSSNTIFISSSAYNDGNWHHIVVSLNQSAGERNVYIDGLLLDTATLSTNSWSGTVGSRVTLGAFYSSSSSSGYSQHLNGSIDQVRIFNKALIADDVSTLYAETSSTASNTNPFNEGAGVALYSMDYDASEESGYFDGTPTDVEFGVGGITNFGARFNGSSSFIQTSLSLDAASNSVSFWFNADSVGSQNPALYFNNRGGRIDITINGTGSNTATSTLENIYINSTTAITGWNFVCIVFTGWASSYSASSYGSAITANVYLNGGSAVSLSPTPYGQSDGLRIGRSGGSYYYDGDIDQVRIFSKALSTSEIDTLYNSGSGETACVHTATTTDNDYPTTNLAYYKLDNSAEDSHSGTYDGTESNIEYRFGKYGQAAVFNGSNAYIDLGTSIATSTRGVSIWVNADNFSERWAFQQGDGQGVENYIRFYNTDDIQVRWGNVTQTFSGYSANTWIHIFAQKDENDNANVWINGVEMGSTGTPSAITVNKTYLGVRNNGGSLQYYFDGKIDQVRLFASALTSSQIIQLYNEKPETDTSNFKTVLYTGNGTSSSSIQYISNVGMDLETSGGLIWTKRRTGSATSHAIVDSLRTIGSSTGYIASDTTDLEQFSSNMPSSLEANGFFVKGSGGRTNSNGQDYVSWVWLGGGEAQQNNDGTINGANCMVSANAAAGFSIVKYTGNGTAGATVGHGLGTPPDLIIVKLLDNNKDWYVFSELLGQSGGEYKYLELNDDDAATTFNTQQVWNGVLPTSNVFTLTGGSADNLNNNDYIAYCFRSVSGYSKIGTYEGNGTTATTTITTDFKPSWVMIRRTDSGNSWRIFDTRRDTTPLNLILDADTNLAEADGGTTTSINITDTGFNMSTSQFGGSINTDGGQYLYMAFK
tara:strand:- start:2311 stop:5355 length:3045 start_codon:yes stop_codon:yes gene_type:complete